MNFQAIKHVLGLSDSTTNGFLSIDLEEQRAFGEGICFSLESPSPYGYRHKVCWIYEHSEDNVRPWAGFEDEDLDDSIPHVMKFMKEENVPLEPLDPELLSCLPAWSGQPDDGKVVTHHGSYFRLENDDCALFFCKRYIWGCDTEMGFEMFEKSGAKVYMTWQNDPIIFTFEKVVEWLRNNGYVYRR